MSGQRLTIDEFLGRVRAKGIAWHLAGGWAVRFSDGDVRSHGLCPIAAFAAPKDRCRAHVRPVAFAEKAGLLSAVDAAEIVRAADQRPGHNPELRRRLLEACGLTEGVS